MEGRKGKSRQEMEKEKKRGAVEGDRKREAVKRRHKMVGGKGWVGKNRRERVGG
jgi:hypothetical protein